jgi:hypothetical protein
MTLKFEEARHKGKADIVKIVGVAKIFADNFHLREIVDNLSLDVPVIGMFYDHPI